MGIALVTIYWNILALLYLNGRGTENLLNPQASIEKEKESLDFLLEQTRPKVESGARQKPDKSR